VLLCSSFLLLVAYLVYSLDNRTALYKNGVELPKDTDILGSLHVEAKAATDVEQGEDQDHEEEEDRERVPCLRETKAHSDLLFYFAKTVMYNEVFKKKNNTSLLSTYMTNTLEAFTVLLYANGYALWKETCDFEVDNSIQRVAKRRWTDDSRGMGKMNGWPTEAHMLYKDMVKRIGVQKEMPALRDFEKDLMGRFQSDHGRSQQRRGAAHQHDGDDGNLEGIMDLSDDGESEEE
jgi:hypothetical protein